MLCVCDSACSLCPGVQHGQPLGPPHEPGRAAGPGTHLSLPQARGPHGAGLGHPRRRAEPQGAVRGQASADLAVVPSAGQGCCDGAGTRHWRPGSGSCSQQQGCCPWALSRLCTVHCGAVLCVCDHVGRAGSSPGSSVWAAWPRCEAGAVVLSRGARSELWRRGPRGSGADLHGLREADACRSASPDSAERVVQRFEVPGVSNYTALLLSPDGGTLYLGARELLIAVNTSHFQPGAPARRVSPRMGAEPHAGPQSPWGWSALREGRGH